jgi:hypothetical protein
LPQLNDAEKKVAREIQAEQARSLIESRSMSDPWAYFDLVSPFTAFNQSNHMLTLPTKQLNPHGAASLSRLTHPTDSDESQINYSLAFMSLLTRVPIASARPQLKTVMMSFKGQLGKDDDEVNTLLSSSSPPSSYLCTLVEADISIVLPTRYFQPPPSRKSSRTPLFFAFQTVRLQPDTSS